MRDVGEERVCEEESARRREKKEEDDQQRKRREACVARMNCALARKGGSDWREEGEHGQEERGRAARRALVRMY